MMTQRELAVYKLAGGPIPMPERDMTPADQLRFAMSILQYNQGFAQFTDGKANTLLLINSIFLASTAASNLSSWPEMIAAGLASFAITCCLFVVYARLPPSAPLRRADLIFFRHIQQRRHRDDYRADFQAVTAEEVTAHMLDQIYDLSRVVNRKFRSYQHAQLATILAALGWLSHHLAGGLLLS